MMEQNKEFNHELLVIIPTFNINKNRISLIDNKVKSNIADKLLKPTTGRSKVRPLVMQLVKYSFQAERS